MPFSYTNRKGQTFYLSKTVTKTGKPRYMFTATKRDESVDEIPQGFSVQESVNGIVSLVKSRPMQLLDSEIQSVRNQIDKHPKSKSYRTDIKSDRIDIYERVGVDVSEWYVSPENGPSVEIAGMLERLQIETERYAQFTPVMQFTLEDSKQRIFRVQRMCYRGSIDDWIVIAFGSVNELTARLIPKLGTEAFFQLF